ncbi:GSCFA domain-containing protein [Aestuariicoccus sp. MJ-SS9]|uniref:GSCFA domain-containing protein n=1 Tax=Aestuariicoccus sp. MJ-SS9 TaxID=3079855 RepID=UPI00290A2D76|nr:GSCFA domain-containing protein [Aestuariicoccus sp. MJ-SS9]MDU8912169.1 GSCFA domain-containing protein [Aestuariicoccus sp. MJ-SS9]
MSASESNPYAQLPPRQFWRSAVAEPGPLGLRDLHRPAFRISPRDHIITAGSCFAQRLSQALLRRGYAWLDAEPAPPMMRPETARRYNYGVFSTRTGNIYTVALLRQWLEWAFAPRTANPEIWQDADGRLRDPLRPAIEPEGFETPAALQTARARTFAALRRAVRKADVFIFTLGLTELWYNRDSGMGYPMCPGTQGGRFDPERHAMKNLFCDSILRDFEAVLALLEKVNPGLKLILTVSPVPLTATAAPDCHALVANTYTKSTLRAVAGEAARRWPQVDYFPSYEMIATPPMRGMFYTPNLRNIAPEGVEFVMKAFFDCYTGSAEGDAAGDGGASALRLAEAGDELVCDEMILDFYNAR